ncbi:MAG: ferrochelatase [Gammaproteobacteria bacterium]
MPKFSGEPRFKHGQRTRIGVLLANLGSPDEATTPSVRRYLAEFLMDPRVVEVPRILWRIILHGVILRIRPPRSARAYQTVWTEEGSPLISISREQTSGIRTRLKERFGDDIEVELAMRYGNPSVSSALQKLNDQNVRNLLVLPLYPQYSAVTSASTFDAVAAVFTRKRWIPELRMINQYHDHPGYIKALAQSVREYRQQHTPGERLLMSFHGIPKRYLINGDPYHCQCHKTARLLADELGLEDSEWAVSFQSRLGREEWLTPYTGDTVEQWAKEGLKTIDTICPGFSADCLETLEEMIEEYGDLFKEHGGDELRYIPCLNAADTHLDFLTELVCTHIQTWTNALPTTNNEAALLDSKQRAASMESNV